MMQQVLLGFVHNMEYVGHPKRRANKEHGRAYCTGVAAWYTLYLVTHFFVFIVYGPKPVATPLRIKAATPTGYRAE